MKIIKSFIAFIVSAALLTATGIGCYFVVKQYILPLFSQTKQPVDTISDWDKLPPEFKSFSEKNSLKIELPTMLDRSVIAGTAWSWYYKKNSENLYDWYLMTNFHVVNETIAYTQDLTEIKTDAENNPNVVIKDSKQLLDYYSTNTSTNIYKKNSPSNKNKTFSLRKFDFKTNGYTDVIRYNSFIESIDIITDFNNDSIDLFSKSNEAGSVLYNLDMALVKISMNFESDKTLLDTKYQRVNTFDNYLKSSNQNIIFDDNNNKEEANYKKTFIAGNPVKHNKLIGTELSTNFQLQYSSLNHGDSAVLSKLRAPYFYSLTNYKDFTLSGGASGSAVYQGIDNNTNLDKVIPVAIYWGGRTYGSNDNPNSLVFSPSLIPFVIESISPTGQRLSVNVFENFKNSIYNKK